MKYWSMYLISTGKRTYIGVTTDVVRRLRQHNREIVGGARSTHSGAPNWKLVMHIEGFTSKSEVMRWEKIVKSRCRGIKERTLGFIAVASGRCPQKKRKHLPHYQPPPDIALYINIPDHLKWRD